MSDNTVLNPGNLGDTVRLIQRPGGSVKTEVVQLDVGGGSAYAESLVSLSNPLPVAESGVIIVELLQRILSTLVSMKMQDANVYGFHVNPSEVSNDEEYN